MTTKRERQQAQDARRFAESDKDLCMLCHAYGADKRSLFISCFYEMKEAVPELLDLRGVEHLKDRGYYLRICKTCRAALLGYLRQWANERRSLRNIPKDHDGGASWYEDTEANIPVRLDGVTVMMTLEQYQQYRERRGE